MTTDTSEKGLELLIMRSLTGLSNEQILSKSDSSSSELPYGYDSAGYTLGRSEDFDRDHAVDLIKLLSFIQTSQPSKFDQLNLGSEGPSRQQFLNRLQGEIAKRGIIEVLRSGVKHGPASIDLFYGIASQANQKAKDQWASNIFSITRQLQYSKDQTQLALDLCLFINGLPIATFELKNKLTKQSVEDAKTQYKKDRDARELLFQFGRCLVHFAVDDQQVWFCTKLDGKQSWFLPFNKGWDDGAGNPPNPDGLKTDYLWKEILRKESLADILENYAQKVEEKNEKLVKKKDKLIFPRYHQLDVVRKLLKDARVNGPGKRYLIQHSAGSGKSNSIAWLAHQLVGLEKGSTAIFDSVVVVTDRVLLDKQIRDTIKQFAQVGSTVGHAEHSGDLKGFLQNGKKIIVTTVQKFPFVLEDIGNDHRDKKFAILIDEAHSSQSGRTAAKMNIALSEVESEEEEKDIEDRINDLMEAKKMLSNASYYAFTATPKNKTLEVFGEPYQEGDEIKHRPFHSYTMKQAIQEEFILDVLANYTPYKSYYSLTKKIEDDPEFDKKRAQKKMKRYVEGHEHAIRQKAEIMIDHFHDQVISKHKVGGQARAMVVTGSIARALEYHRAFQAYLKERKSPYLAIVAFSGEHEFAGEKVTEASMNGFPSSKIAEKIQEDPYRFLICADKFQTGYDEPLMHTMYVDKALSDIKAVQTLSRLNRAYPGKRDTFILDFVNDADGIEKSFNPFYRTTLLSKETDPNKLHDLKADLDGYQVYDEQAIDNLVELYLGGADREKLEPILESSVELYVNLKDEDKQVDFKGKAKAFIRTYGFLSSILTYSNAEWEKLSIFLNFLTPKLPAPKETDLSKGVLESIDMESYRVEARSTIAIALEDDNHEIEPVPGVGGGKMPEPELAPLSSIIKEFNDLFGNIDWNDGDKIGQLIIDEIPAKVASDTAYQNAMKNNDKQNARIEHDKALFRVLLELLSDQTELYKQYSTNPGFKKWLSDKVFTTTYQPGQTI